MFVYTDQEANFILEDKDDIEVSYETYIYTETNIYKKYKKHFFPYILDSNVEIISVDGRNFYLEYNTPTLNKKKILTSIPYKCLFVNRKVITSRIHDGIIFRKEIDNDCFSSSCFVIDDFKKIKSIGLFLK